MYKSIYLIKLFSLYYSIVKFLVNFYKILLLFKITRSVITLACG